MAKFIEGNTLNAELENVFKNAEKEIVIISPYIKLHSRFEDILFNKKDHYNLKITIVFGKNDGDYSKSLNKDTFEFLKDFPNIEIKYEPRLHAKYYSNEYDSLLSSMNLYDFSQDNNIEFGILTKTKLIGIGDSIDKDADEYFTTVIKRSKILFLKTPKTEEKMLGLKKKYTHSETEIDKLSKHFGYKSQTKKKPAKQSQNTNRIDKVGYCIRTGKKIPFNIEQPFTDSAFKSWNKYKDENYKEKYCHFSGEPSNGETCKAKPVLKKNWTKINK